MDELVSIFSPVYNISSRYPGALERFLDSIANQTYKNIEVILVDDGSTDDSAAICDQWALKDSRFHVVRHGTNRTINKARETGFRHCTGSLVFNADPDDLLHPQAIEIQHALLASHPECDMVVGHITHHWGDNVDFTPIVQPNYEVLDQPASIHQMFRRGNHTFWNKLYRRKLLESIDWDITRINDVHLTLQIWLKGSLFIHLYETTYYWMQRELSVTHSNPADLSLQKFDTLIMDWNRYMRGKHPEYYADYLYRSYVIATEGYYKLTDSSVKKAWRAKLSEFLKISWKECITSDASLIEKMALLCAMRFPGLKPFFSKVKHSF